MINFRNLKKDYSANVLKEGKTLFDEGAVLSAKVVSFDADIIRLSSRVLGSYDHVYECEVEVDRSQSTMMDADCDCPYQFDCQHLAASLFYLEDHIHEILINYSKEEKFEKQATVGEKEKETFKKTIAEAKTKEAKRKQKKYQKELIEEYIGASEVLGGNPFFLPVEELQEDKAELAVILLIPEEEKRLTQQIDLQLALRLPFRSKPLMIPDIKEFFDAVSYQQPIYFGSRRLFFSRESFDQPSRMVLEALLDFSRYSESGGKDRSNRIAHIESERLGIILSLVQEWVLVHQSSSKRGKEDENVHSIPCFYHRSLEEPLKFASSDANLRFELEYLESPAPKILFNPKIVVDHDVLQLCETRFLECAKPALIHKGQYYRFSPKINRQHLRSLPKIQAVTIPEPLFGTFVENALPELASFAEVFNDQVLDQFATLPFAGKLNAECDLVYLDGELEATLCFLYDGVKVPAVHTQLSIDTMCAFVGEDGILARNLSEEKKLVDALFQGFMFDSINGNFISKTDKKIVEFMTEVIPRFQERVKFHCPENLLEQFIYDDTTFELKMTESDQVDSYLLELKVNGQLDGFTLDAIWECLSTRKCFIELSRKPKKGSKKRSKSQAHKILVLDLERLAPVIHLFDEIGITSLETHQECRPLWSLASFSPDDFKDLPIKFSISPKLNVIRDQMLGQVPIKPSCVPKEILAKLRCYQKDGIQWLEKLRMMHLNGILADDMGLGKTLQAIVAVKQFYKNKNRKLSLVVCPTSLVYNWKEEFHKFCPSLRVLPVDGTPQQRKKLMQKAKSYDLFITSYTLLQKDIELYQSLSFGYVILDEAQHIKNRGTRNAKSVKQLKAAHRLILTGTPIENSLEELWSLFDFLMPGLLSTYDRFIEKYLRLPTQNQTKNLEGLKRKLSPFIMRRMKQEVLSELPPVSEIAYHCHLSDTQKKLYKSYAESARKELSQLVAKEGFDRVQIHVLATLTRLKQICCHPALFAKDKPEEGDSAKYEMLMELISNLIEGNHKTVIFSQYTRMLQIIRDDLIQRSIRFEYLDGSSKNRLSIVKRFNEDQSIPIFLVSLKAGGSGLNLVGADTVIHYDMWWNPAVENQATDRVHRIGQKKSVSAYKLVTLNTIEEKIIDLQNRKRELVKHVVSTDEEAMSKLTWEEVLELLQT